MRVRACLRASRITHHVSRLHVPDHVCPVPNPITALIGALAKLPGIGPRSAERIALHLVQAESGAVKQLADTILTARERVRFCEVCGALTEKSPCAICADPRRDASLVCVVERPVDIISVEKSGTFRGNFHVLGGKISPAQRRRAGRLAHRRAGNAAGARADQGNRHRPGHGRGRRRDGLLPGQTARAPGLKITRIAHGLPAGTGLEFADELTLSRALEGRRELL